MATSFLKKSNVIKQKTLGSIALSKGDYRFINLWFQFHILDNCTRPCKLYFLLWVVSKKKSLKSIFWGCKIMISNTVQLS